MKINTMKLKLTALLLVLYTGLYAQNKIVLTAPRLDTSSLSNRINLKANTNLNNVNGVLSSTYGGAGSVNGILKANGSGVVSPVIASDITTLISGTYLPLSGGTLTGALNGTSAAFSGATQLATSSGRVLIKTTYDNGTDALQVAGSGLFTGTINANSSGGNIRIKGTTLDGGLWVALGDIIRLKDWATGTKGLDIDIATGAITASSSVTANSFVKSGGTSAQFLMADGSVTTGPFMDLSSNQTAAGNKTFSGITSITNTTAATGTTNGALVVSGGVGVGGSVIASAMAANSGTFYNSVYGAVIRSATATYTTTATVASDITTAFCSGSGYTLTLPSASGITGQLLTVISNTTLTGITLSGVEGTTYTLICNSSLVLVSNGTTWKIASVYQNSGSCS